MVITQKPIPGLLKDVESIPRQRRLKAKRFPRRHPGQAEIRLALYRHRELDREFDERLQRPRA